MYSLLLLLLGAPLLICQRLFLGKYRNSLSQRLGFSLPKMPKGGSLIWIHAVSLGETKAVMPLCHMLQREYANSTIVFSNTTETGHQEATKSLPGIVTFYLPLDIGFIMRRLVKRLHPDLLIFVETDCWYNLMRYAKKEGAKILLVNGKISEKSAKRFGCFPELSKRFFGKLDLLCLQNQEYQERFAALGVSSDKLHITGNLKSDIAQVVANPEALRKMLPSNAVIILLASTHDQEEKLLLKALKAVQIPNLRILLAPRHPNRFPLVANFLTEEKIIWASFSQGGNPDAEVILIDTMGSLGLCYQLSHLSLICGSFIPGIGGHNLLEPLQLGSPLIFGPYTDNQTEFASKILAADAGIQAAVEELPELVLRLLNNPVRRQELSAHGTQLVQQMQGGSSRTLLQIKKIWPAEK